MKEGTQNYGSLSKTEEGSGDTAGSRPTARSLLTWCLNTLCYLISFHLFPLEISLWHFHLWKVWAHSELLSPWIRTPEEFCLYTSSELRPARSVWSRSVFRGHSATQTAEEKVPSDTPPYSGVWVSWSTYSSSLTNCCCYSTDFGSCLHLFY